ncbi:MAG: MmcQ/YjbR family DNA-binding protein, partial [Verrucomicrobium sp.]
MRTLLLIALFFSIGSLTQARSQTPVSPRPPFGAPADAKLINGRWFAAIMEKVDWIRAKSKCEALGG